MAGLEVERLILGLLALGTRQLSLLHKEIMEELERPLGIMVLEVEVERQRLE